MEVDLGILADALDVAGNLRDAVLIAAGCKSLKRAFYHQLQHVLGGGLSNAARDGDDLGLALLSRYNCEPSEQVLGILAEYGGKGRAVDVEHLLCAHGGDSSFFDCLEGVGFRAQGEVQRSRYGGDGAADEQRDGSIEVQPPFIADGALCHRGDVP